MNGSKSEDKNKNFNHMIFSEWEVTKHGVPQGSVLVLYFFFLK